MDFQIDQHEIDEINFKNFFLPVVVIALVLALSASAIGIQRSILAFYTSDLSFYFSKFLAGALTLTLFGTAKAIGSYYGGTFSDKIGRKKSVIVGVSIIFIGNLSLTFVKGLVGFVIGNTLLGGGAGMVFSSAMISLTDYSGVAKRSQAVSLMEMSVYTGTAIGSFLPSIFPNQPFIFLFRVSLIISIVLLLISFKGIKESGSIINIETRSLEITPEIIFSDIERESEKFGIVIPSPLKEELFRILEGSKYEDDFNNEIPLKVLLKPTLVVIIMTGVISRILDTAFILVYPLWLSTEMENASQTFSLLNTVFLVSWAIGIVLSPNIVKLIGRRFPLIFGVFAEFAFFFFLAKSHELPILLALAFGAGISLGIYYPLPSAALADLVPPKVRGKSIGIYRLFLDLGYLIGSAFLLVLEKLIDIASFPEPLKRIDILHLLLVVVVFIGIAHSVVLILFLKDSRPVWKQFNFLSNHIQKIKSMYKEITLGIQEFTAENIFEANQHEKQAKSLEIQADMVLQELTRKTYSGTFPKKDAFELLQLASRVDKAAGNALRGLRRLLALKEYPPKEFMNYLSFYSIIGYSLVKSLEKSIEALNVGLGIAITKAIEVGAVEELLDAIYRHLWKELSQLEFINQFSLLTLKDAIELMEKSTNQLEDASEIIRLLGYKYYV